MARLRGACLVRAAGHQHHRAVGLLHTLPTDVWDALLAGAAARLAPALAPALSHGITSVTVLDISVDYGSRRSEGPLHEQAQAWRQEFEDAVGRYRVI